MSKFKTPAATRNSFYQAARQAQRLGDGLELERIIDRAKAAGCALTRKQMKRLRHRAQDRRNGKVGLLSFKVPNLGLREIPLKPRKHEEDYFEQPEAEQGKLGRFRQVVARLAGWPRMFQKK